MSVFFCVSLWPFSKFLFDSAIRLRHSAFKCLWHLFSSFRHLSSVIPYLSSVNYLLSSDIRHLKSNYSLKSRVSAQMTCHPVLIAQIFQLRFFPRADIHAAGTAGMKAAAGRRIDGAGDITSQNNSLTFSIEIGDRYGWKQGLGVGVCGVGIHIPVGGHFHYLSQIHHGDAITDIFHHRQIMGDDWIMAVTWIAWMQRSSLTFFTCFVNLTIF